MTDELNKIDPKLAANPLINPSKATLDNLKSWTALTDQQTSDFNKAYAPSPAPEPMAGVASSNRQRSKLLRT